MNELPPEVRRKFRARRELKDQVSDEVDAEVKFHLESRIEELVTRGLDREEAKRQTLEEFGDLERAKRALRRESEGTERKVRVSDWIHDVGLDVRYGWRKLVSRAGIGGVAILTLAIGIGANTVAFSLVHSVLLKPLPYPDQDRLVALYEHDPNRAVGPDGRAGVAYQNFVDWREAARSFRSMAAFTGTSAVMTGGELPERISGAAVTPGFFATLGVMPAYGRAFATEEAEPGADDVVVLSDALWRRQFGGDPAVLGQRIVMDGAGQTVVGVMPPGFDFPPGGPEFWVPFALDPEDGPSRGEHWFRGIARLASGVTMEGAQAEMDAIAARLAEAYPETNAGDGVMVLSLHGSLHDRETGLGLWTLLGVAAFVLLIACANLANLLLVRASGRAREFAVRAALGAGKGRLIRQVMIESMMVALAGGAVGLAIAYGGIPAIAGGLSRVWEGSARGLADAGVNTTVLLFSALATVVTGLLVGLIPALSGSRTDLVESLKEGTSGSGAGGARSRLRSGLVVVEVALAIVLLAGAGLMVKSFLHVQGIDPGFRPGQLLSFRVSPPGDRYEDRAAVVGFFRTIEERIAALPGVTSVSVVNTVPVGGNNWSSDSWTIEGRPPWQPGEEPSAGWLSVLPDYLETMGIPLIRGRFIEEGDVDGAEQVVAINETFARRYWPDSDPVGERFIWWDEPRRIVGVVGDVRHNGPLSEVRPEAYFSFQQVTLRSMDVLVRTEEEPESLLPAIRSAIWETDPLLPLYNVATAEERLGDSVSRPRVLAMLVAGFAVIAALLAAVGIYGVMSFAVAVRTREIGLRLALGAERGWIMTMVIRSAAVLAGLGVALGLAGAGLLTRLISGLLYGVSPLDPMTFAAVASLALITALVSSWLPAWRASRVDPMVALREETR